MQSNEGCGGVWDGGIPTAGKERTAFDAVSCVPPPTRPRGPEGTARADIYKHFWVI